MERPGSRENRKVKYIPYCGGMMQTDKRPKIGIKELYSGPYFMNDRLCAYIWSDNGLYWMLGTILPDFNRNI